MGTAATFTPAVFTGTENVTAVSAQSKPAISAITAYRQPSTKSTVVAEVEARDDTPLAFMGVVDYQRYQDHWDEVTRGGRWLQVYLPVRPNGATGWIELANVDLYENPFTIEIDIDEFQLTVSHRGEPQTTVTIAVGSGVTPTPVGQFYTTILLEAPDPNGLYGPFAFGLSGFSESVTDFRNGSGIVGIHGTDDPNSLGTEISLGCVRVENEIIRDLAERLPLGTPVLIRE